MTYEETLEWMFRQIPMYQRTGKAAYKVDLQRTHQLDAYFGHPHHQFKTIHVAGTNGKGSVSHMIASVFQEAGYKTGLYTSPHLKDFRERIRVNGQLMEKEYVTDFIQQHKNIFSQVQPSFFEMTVAMAFDYFRNQQIDVAVVEVGMGGRLDSTNIISPDVSVITNIGLDHTQFLGETIAEIAQEKAGVIKPHTPVVIGETNEQTKSVFLQKAQQEAAPVFFADQHYKLENAHLVDDLYMQYQVEQDSQPLMEALLSDLLGSYQQKNLVTALKTIEILREKGFAIQESHLRNGLQQVTRNTGFKGRWFVLQRNPWVICDTAHNREGLSYIMQQLQELHVPHIHFVLGFVNDKNLDNVLDLFPTSGSYYFTKADIPRALDEKQLAAKAGEYYLKGTTHPTVAKALEAAMANAGIEDLIYLGGSTFVVSEII